LADTFRVRDYTGVEINQAAAAAGRQMNAQAKIFEGDILHAGASGLADQQFNLVLYLSCGDSNVEVEPMFRTA
jgi:hypothetical protein